LGRIGAQAAGEERKDSTKGGAENEQKPLQVCLELMNSLRKLTSESVVVAGGWYGWMVKRSGVAFVAVVDASSTAGQGYSRDFSGMEMHVWEW
jgi:hypothetical protein